MFLTVSKRLEFSASRRLHRDDWSEQENRAAFGAETAAIYGAGRNYVAWFVFTGQVDPGTGMLMNISEIKRRAGTVIDERYDHRFLNEDNESFDRLVPTPENVAGELAREVAPLFAEAGARLAAVHLIESPERSATAYASGRREANFHFNFSAARRTISPQLSERENQERFGAATKIHGHNYRVRLTLDGGEVPSVETRDVIDSLVGELDHRSLNDDVPALQNKPVTTENLARFIYERALEKTALLRVRIYERDDFFAEYDGEQRFLLGMLRPFSAAHRLQSYELSPEENTALYGKCNNPRGHGHLYLAEAAIGGSLDPRSGTLFEFSKFQEALRGSLAGWENHHLDQEVEEFRETPSTGENIVQKLWPKIDDRVDGRLERLRLWETANNRFTLRRTAGSFR